MQKFNTLLDAVDLARFAHAKQTDKGGAPYIDHPLRVAAKVQQQRASVDALIAAVLHDVTEDTTFTPEILYKLGFSERVVQLVRLLDRNESAWNWWYLSLGTDAEEEFYYKNIRNDPEAKLIKLADIEDNLLPWRLEALPEKTQERLKKKYTKAKRLLND